MDDVLMLELQKAKHGFRQFIRKLSAFRDAHYVRATSLNPSVEKHVKVTRTEAS